MKQANKLGQSLLAIASMLSLSLAKPAGATTFICDGGGTIVLLGIGGDGTVTVNLGYGYFYICSLSATSNGVTPDACRGWYSTLLSHRLTNKPVRLYFDDTNSTNIGLTPAMCASGATFPTSWVYHAPYFLEPLK